MMSWWNAKYTNGNGDNEITFGSKYYERAKAVEKVCQAVIDKKVKTPDDVAVVTRCKGCKHYLIADEFDGGKRYMCDVTHFSYLNSDGDMHYCSYGEPKENANADDHD